MPYDTFFRLPEDKQKRICDGALKEFSAYRDHYSKASVNRIAEYAGISVGSLYKYFSSKHELLLYFYDLQVVQEEPKPEQIHSPALLSYFQEKMKARTGSETKTRDLLFRIILKNKESLLYPLFVEDIKNTLFYSKVLDYLERDREEGILREDVDLEHAAYMYLMIDFIAYNYCDFKENEPEYTKESVMKFMKIYFHGIYKDLDRDEKTVDL